MKKYFDETPQLEENAKAVEYSYPITPVIYKKFSDEDIRKFNPDETFTKINGENNPFASFLSMGSSNIGQFNKLPEDERLYKDQYQVLTGR